MAVATHDSRCDDSKKHHGRCNHSKKHGSRCLLTHVLTTTYRYFCQLDAELAPVMMQMISVAQMPVRHAGLELSTQD